MRYNVYVVTAAQFIGEVYAALLDGHELGTAVSAARRQLAASPLRRIGGQPRPLQDWLVPVVYEARPLALRDPLDGRRLTIGFSQAEADRERTSLGPALPPGPTSGFFGRDETLVTLDRAFDSRSVVLLQAWAGAGKTSTALEFARWYTITGGVKAALFTSFAHHLPLAQLLEQVRNLFSETLARFGAEWGALTERDRHDWALRVLANEPVVWVWDNVESVAGFPDGTPSAWIVAEQEELLEFLRELAQHTRCKVLLTSRRDEQSWLGSLPRRVRLPMMPMLERLELARAIAAQQQDDEQQSLEMGTWRPLLEFTQGNPLTVTILTRQAIHDQHVSGNQIEAFVAELRAGAANVSDDARQGRDASLAASLNYGFADAFTEEERAKLALLALFQGFADVEVLRWMGHPENGGGQVPSVTGLDRAAGITLLNRAAEVGLLTAYPEGYYEVHPAVPWHLRGLFERHYGPPGSPQAEQALHAWTAAMSDFGKAYAGQRETADSAVMAVLGAEEANLLRAQQLAYQHGWWDLVMGPVRGLFVLYDQTGRTVEWRRLVANLVPGLVDPAGGGPLPGREEQWVELNDYRLRIARQARDWGTAESLQQASIAWQRQQVAAALGVPVQTINDIPQRPLDERQRREVRALAVTTQQNGNILFEQRHPGCVRPYLDALRLFQRTGARHEESTVANALGNAYLGIPRLRDLDEAERWYQRANQLLGEDDTVGHAQVLRALGTVALERFKEAARSVGAAPARAHEHLRKALAAYSQALELFPADAVDDLAIVHNQLGIVYGRGGNLPAALDHFQKSIQYDLSQQNIFGAGESRFNAGLELARAGRGEDALLYLRAALRDYEAIGAAAYAAEARQLIAALEQHPPTWRQQ